ncbi:sterile alpha motif domain-containing protein 9-like [Patiria miniata]|uniref:Sterile alpha motif domain-containing protein 9-like n=1 Tax=Patiria miniata TaxID=46514 RepID=A0A914B6J6_PATMI|nr:sterile alpha motif domain-containing protein 9-like [Patiria miniata]
MALKTYADWENAVKAARVNYDHSQSKMVTKTKAVRKSKKMAFLSVFSMTRAAAVSSEPKSNKKSPTKSQTKQHTVKESENKRCLAKDKKRTIQIIVETPLDSTFCLQLHPSTSISSLKGLLQDRLGIDPEKQHLFTRKGFELCDALSLEDHNIQQDTNLELRLVSGLMGGTRKDKNKTRSTKSGKEPSQDDSSKEKEPTPGRLDDTVLEGAAANNQSSKPRDSTQHTTVHDAASMELPVHMSDWTEYDVKRWLISLGVSDGVVNQLFDEQIDGRVLKLYTEDHLTKDFSINKRDMRLIMYEREHFLRQPESSPITKDTSFSDKKEESEPLQDETHVHQIQTSTVEPEKKTDEVFNDIPQASVRPKIPKSKATISSQKTEKAELPDTLPPHQSPRLDILPPSGKAKPFDERDEPLQRPVSRGEMAPLQKTSEHAQRHDESKPDVGKDVCPKPNDQTPPSSHGDDESERQAFGEKNKKSTATSPKGESSDTPPHMSAVEISKDDEAKVRMLLTGDEHGELSQSFYPVLVANKPTVLNKSTESEIDPFRQQFGFIKDIKWTAVLDFDATSLSDGLCKLYHEKRMVTLQEPDLFKDIKSEEDLKELRKNIGFPEKTIWLFANGREDNPSIRTPHMDLQEWNKERSRDVEASINFFSQPSVIPKDRASIVFLLLSDDDLGIVCDIFRKMFSSFKGLHNITCIAENENVYSQFVKGVEKWVTKPELDERSVVGLKWQEINGIIMRMSGVNQVEANELPTRMAGKCFLSEKQKEQWDDITVVCKNECENTDMDESSQDYQKFAEKKEVNFYRGAKVDWWNFSIGEREMNLHRGCGHVLKRKGFGEMSRKVRKPLDSSKAKESLIVTVTLLHQPGAGGTTLARHVLWELRHDFRCIVVNRVTKNTVNQIMGVRRHGYNEDSTESTQKIPPVCVLVDDIDEVELLDLIDELKDVSRDMHLDGGAVCVLLHCKRCSEPETLVDSERRELFIALTQKLDSREKEWFQKKYNELEHKEKELKTAEYNPEHLLAFMVMKEEFSKEYIAHVVSKILSDIQPNEFELIKLCAFLNSYRPEAAIPISCCDSLMDRRSLPRSRRLLYSTHPSTRRVAPWETLVSSSFQIIVVAEDKELRIFHESIAREALTQTLQIDNQSLVDVAMDFLKSELFRSWSHSKESLKKATRDLLVIRKRKKHGDDTETKYAVLIEDIRNKHEPEKAIEILKIGFETLEDAFVAQQLARLYLTLRNIEMAHLYADKALQLDPKNCYFWDTKGRVYKTATQEKSSKYMEEQQVVCDEFLSNSYGAMDAFHTSYEVSKEAKQTEYTGLYAEVEVAFRLLEVIGTCVEPFRTKGGKADLKKYLLNIKPSDHPQISDRCHARIMNLKDRVDSVLSLLDDMSTFCKDDPTASTGQKLAEMKEHLKEYFKIYERYYGEPKPAQPSKYQDPTSLAEYWRRQVKESKCGTFRDIFDLARNKELRTLDESLQLLLKNSNQYNFFDLKTIICIHLALSSAKEQLVSADEVYQQFVQPLNAIDHRKTDCFPPFFMMMFLWPVPDVDSERLDGYDLSYYIDALRKRWQDLAGKRLAQERWSSRPQNKPRTYFFLGQGKDLQVFAHINELHPTPGKIDRAERDDEFWSSRPVKERLVRLEGTLQHHTFLVHLSKKGKIEIKLAVPFNQQVPSREAVTFYLGFTWDGPVAYDVKIKGKESRNDAAPRFHHAYPSLTIPSEKSKTSLSKNLSKIDQLQKDRQNLNKERMALLASPQEYVKETTSKGDVWTLRTKKIQECELQLKGKQDELRRLLQEDTSLEDGP